MISLESRPPNIEGEGEVRIRELVRNALRMRPDRIVVGEVRGAETLDMLQAMNTGHEGSLTTIHANSPRDALSRLETLVLMGGLDLPLHAIREQIASALDIIVHLTRLVDGSRRLTHITEVVGMESEIITLQDVFAARPVDERAAAAGSATFLRPLSCTGLQPRFQEKLAGRGVVIPPDFYEPDGTEAVLRALPGERAAAMRDLLYDSAWGPIALGLVVGCLVLVAVVIATATPRKLWIRNRLGLPADEPDAAPDEGPTGLRARLAFLFGATERALGDARPWRALERLLERAKPAGSGAVELVYLIVGCALAAAIVAGAVSRSGFVTLLALVAGGLAPYAYVVHRANKRTNAFEEQLPDVLVAMSGSLQVGPQLQPGNADRRRQGTGAGERGVRSRARREPPRTAARTVARRHGHARGLREPPVRADVGRDPASDRRQPRGPVRHDLGDDPRAAAVRAEGEGADRDGQGLGLRPDRPALRDGRRDLRREPELHPRRCFRPPRGRR